MADCLKFHQLLIRGSVTMNIETYIWMLLAALRSESPQSNTNMVSVGPCYSIVSVIAFLQDWLA